jgi:signal peptidase I
MSPSFSDKGDSPAVLDGGPDDHQASRSVSSAATLFGRRRRGSATARVSAVRSPQELDYRLRGLDAPAGTQPPATEPVERVPPKPERTDHRPRRQGPLLVKVTILTALAALAVLLLRAFVLQPFAVPGDAMTPTLQAGDRILVVKSRLLEDPIHSGEIVVFRAPQSLSCTVVGGRGGDLVLRVVALPGQTIWSVDKTIFVDGRPLSEAGWYNPRSGPVGSTPIRSTTLGPDQYFVMADNRLDACDSRVFGPISKSSIVGEGIAIVGRHGHVYFGKV